MFKKKYDVAIVNRSFWPDYPIIGEGLLRLAESYSKSYKTLVLSQGVKPLTSLMKEKNRGKGLDSKTYIHPVDSSISLLRRVVDSIGFMLWVFIQLAISRPKVVYVSTDPPITVPFVVYIYCKLFRARYIYHLQDIHPEITSIYLDKGKSIVLFLKFIDNITIRNAEKVIVLSNQMKISINERCRTEPNISILSNPAYTDIDVLEHRDYMTILFCGNAGRLQRIPLLVQSITEYLLSGGKLHFKFIGAGIYQKDLLRLAERFEKNVSYVGRLPADEAARITRECQWGLMPIEDEVTKYAFPSKSSTYAAAGVTILAVCAETTSVAEWVKFNRVGFVINPDQSSLVACFRKIEKGEIKHHMTSNDLELLRNKLSFKTFVNDLKEIINMEKS